MKKIIFTLFLFLFWKINVFSAPVTHKQTVTYDNGALIAGVAFSDDGKKVFTSFANKDSTVGHHINEFNLSVPYDISSGTYAGDGERCLLDQISTSEQVYDLELKDSGKKLFVTTRGLTTNEDASRLADNIFRYDLETAFDISTCAFSQKAPSLETEALEFINGSNAGNVNLSTRFKRKDHRLQGIDLSTNGKKMFLSWFNNGDATRILEYSLNTPFDLTTMSLVTSAGILLTTSDDNGVDNASGMSFSKNGKRIFIVSHAHSKVARITQISLTSAFDTSTFKIDGNLVIDNNGSLGDFNDQPRGIDFSPSGLKMYVGNDHDDNIDEIMEYDLACPFNIISGGNCELNNNRVASAEAKIELAKRTIDYSTKSVLNRLKWVRRHKEKQNLTNLNMNFHFSDPKFNILSEALKPNIKQINTNISKKNENDKEETFYWSEGNISFGRDGETSLASHKDINVTSITYGADKVTKNKGLEGIALRFGVDNVDVGSNGSKIDSQTYNFTYYRTFQRDNETSFLDTILGIGLIESDIRSVNGEIEFLNKNRLGKQIYMTIKNSDHIERDSYTVVPAAQFDLGHTKFDAYQERKVNGDGSGGIRFEDQNITSGNMRASLGYFKDLKDEKYIVKSRAKIEYQTEFLIKPDIEYSYISDPSSKYSTDLSPNNGDGLNHIINAEIGLDANIGPYELFVIYEQNRKLNYGYVHNFYFSIGHLPENGTKTSYSIKGSENLITNLNIEKNIENILLSFYLENKLENPFTYQQANINLKTTF